MLVALESLIHCARLPDRSADHLHAMGQGPIAGPPSLLQGHTCRIGAHRQLAQQDAAHAATCQAIVRARKR